MLHAQVGKIGFIPDIMGVYRRNAGGIWTNTNKSDGWFVKNTMPCLKCYEHASVQFNHDFTSSMIATAIQGICSGIRTNNMAFLKQIHDTYPEIWDMAVQYINGQDIDAIQKRTRKYKRLFNIFLSISIIELIIILILGVVL